jgi:aminopeptidase N
VSLLTTNHTKQLSDYQKPSFSIEKTDLIIDIHDQDTLVTSELKIKRVVLNSEALILDGEALELLDIKLDGKKLDQDKYQITGDSKQASQLLIPTSLNEFTLSIRTRIYPKNNTSLQGLYCSNKMYCTQCEAEGFRKITYYLDRPDVLSIFTTKIIADINLYPVLLSNGNLVDQGEVGQNKHYKTYEDPHPKPSYLFALVAGNLALKQDKFITMYKREVTLSFYTEPGDEDKTVFAIEALKKSMRWDEKNYQREYDLQDYKVVAVHDFNMGAMENKGLNIFNAKYILADKQIATDSDYQHIEAVIAHEYFHNWTGNRVTCRDWFQLSLKEGLTVFREQQFCADQGLESFKRIQDVELMHSRQFAEDAGPMSHPVQPQSYVEINNFYTMTIYHKGAEVIRMLSLLLGYQGFGKGMTHYFNHYDGQAVTIYDFLNAFEATNSIDLSQFKLWYTQSGTPEITVKSDYDAKKKTYKLTLEQHTAPTADQTEKQALVIPVECTLISQSGELVHSDVLILDTDIKTFQFEQVPDAPVPSFLGNFSAPVKVYYDYTTTELAQIIQHDISGVARWSAAQRFYLHLVKNNLENITVLTSVLKNILNRIAYEIEHFSYHEKVPYDYALESELLSVPDVQYFIGQDKDFDLDNTLSKIKLIKLALADHLFPEINNLYGRIMTLPEFDPKAEQEEAYLSSYAQGLRAMKNKLLTYLCLHSETNHIYVKTQYELSENMTDRMGALQAIKSIDCALRADLVQDFYDKWQQEPLVVNKWLMLEATSDLPGTFERVKYLTGHPAFHFYNPNQVYALIGGFTQHNWAQFYQSAPESYLWLADIILKLDERNPQVSARMTEAFLIKDKLDSQRKAYITQALTKIKNKAGLSPDLGEIISKSLK